MRATGRKQGGSYAGLAAVEDPELRARVALEVARRRRLAGEVLRQAREGRDVGRGELSTATGLSLVTIGRIERGESGSDWSCGRIADYLGLAPDWLRHLDEPVDEGREDELRADRTEETLSILGRLARLDPPDVDAIREIIARVQGDRRRSETIAREPLHRNRPR